MKLRQEESQLKDELQKIDKEWEEHKYIYIFRIKFTSRKPYSLPPPSIYDDKSYMSYRSYYSEMPIPKSQPKKINPILQKPQRKEIGKSNR